MSIISHLTEWLLVHQDRLCYLNWSDVILSNIISQNCLAHGMMNWSNFVCSGRELWVQSSKLTTKLQMYHMPCYNSNCKIPVPKKVSIMLWKAGLFPPSGKKHKKAHTHMRQIDWVIWVILAALKTTDHIPTTFFYLRKETDTLSKYVYFSFIFL